MKMSEAVSNMLRHTSYRRVADRPWKSVDTLYSHFTSKLHSNRRLDEALHTIPYEGDVPTLYVGPFVVAVNPDALERVPINSVTSHVIAMFATVHAVDMPKVCVPIILMAIVPKTDNYLYVNYPRDVTSKNSPFAVYIPDNYCGEPAKFMYATSSAFWGRHRREVMAWAAFTYDRRAALVSPHRTIEVEDPSEFSPYVVVESSSTYKQRWGT